MSRLLFQYEDQSRAIRADRDLMGSFFYVLRTSVAIFAMGCAVSVVSSFVTGDDQFLVRLISLV